MRSCINNEADEITLDFGFISRSFCDELCNIIDDNKDKTSSFVNQNDEVETMMRKVREGRGRERKRGISNAKTYEFNDMESLSKFLLAM